jgi:hypothetical protein
MDMRRNAEGCWRIDKLLLARCHVPNQTTDIHRTVLAIRSASAAPWYAASHTNRKAAYQGLHTLTSP